MPLKLPPPPKSRGVVGLILTVSFVIWTGYLMTTYASKKPAETSPLVVAEPSFVEIDLRGPKYDVGRYDGYQQGKAAKLKGFSAPTDSVLTFEAAENARLKVENVSETEDLVAGYKSGFSQAMTESKEAKVTPVSPQR